MKYKQIYLALKEINRSNIDYSKELREKLNLSDSKIGDLEFQIRDLQRQNQWLKDTLRLMVLDVKKLKYLDKKDEEAFKELMRSE